MFTRIKKIVVGALRERKKSQERSPQWPTVRRKHLARYPSCAACGGTKLLQVHHREPYHLNPSLELDMSNLITLCLFKGCHVDLGHSGSYLGFNPNVDRDCAAVLADPTKREIVIALAEKNRRYTEEKGPGRI